MLPSTLFWHLTLRRLRHGQPTIAPAARIYHRHLVVVLVAQHTESKWLLVGPACQLAIPSFAEEVMLAARHHTFNGQDVLAQLSAFHPDRMR